MEIDIKIAVRIFDAAFEDILSTEQEKLEVVQQLLFNSEYWPHTFFKKDWQPKVEKMLLFHYPKDIYQLSMNPAFVLFKTSASFDGLSSFVSYNRLRADAKNYGTELHKSLDTEYFHTSSTPNPTTVASSKSTTETWTKGDVIRLNTEYFGLRPGDTVIIIDCLPEEFTNEMNYLCEYTNSRGNHKRYWIRSEVGDKICSIVKPM